MRGRFKYIKVLRHEEKGFFEEDDGKYDISEGIIYIENKEGSISIFHLRNIEGVLITK